MVSPNLEDHYIVLPPGVRAVPHCDVILCWISIVMQLTCKRRPKHADWLSDTTVLRTMSVHPHMGQLEKLEEVPMLWAP